MFDASAFKASLDQVSDLLKRLGEGADWNFGTQGLEVAMNGRGVPKGFVRAITEAAEKGQSSNHARLRLQQILSGELAAALKTLRQRYAGASGGLPPSDWRSGMIRFVLANGGSVGATWIIPGFAPNYERKATIPLPSDHTQFAKIARRLERHSRLDLSGPPRLFELGEKGNQLSPFTISAPDPGRALARFIVLTRMNQNRFCHIREIIDAEQTIAAASYHLGQIEKNRD